MASQGLATLRPHQTEDLLSNFELLQKAIQLGHVEKAKQVVSDLAKKKANVQVTERHDNTPSLNDNEMSVKIYVEDKELSGSQLTMKFRPSFKIKELKRMMLKKHGFPPEIQKWIIGKKIVKDEDTLQRLRVKSGSAMYLYLLSPESVGLTREDYSRKYGADLPYGTQGLPVTEEERVRYQRLQSNRSTPLTPRNNTVEPPREYSENEYLVPVQSPPPPPQTNQTQPVRPPPPPEPEILSYADVGWTCPQCTYKNEPTRPGCEMCSHDKPDDYIMPEGIEYVMTDKEKRRLQREKDAERQAEQMRQQQEVESQRIRIQNYDYLLASSNQDVITNQEEFDCPICFDTIQPGDGVRLRECLHQFCRLCLAAQIVASEDPQIKCPHQDEEYSCPSVLLDREIKMLAPLDAYEKYLQRGLSQAESQAANSFHCKTTDCRGWCLYDDDVNFFDCIVCGKKNCLTCKAIHEGQNCKEYQEDLCIKAQNDVNAKKTNDALQEMLQKGDAMECPQCRVVITKKLGCDWLRCTMCKTEICWVTKGRRWGPGGTGDLSGGCKCNINRVKCHPNCQNCH